MSHSNKLDFLHIVFTNILSHAPSATMRKLETVGLQKMNFSITQKNKALIWNKINLFSELLIQTVSILKKGPIVTKT